jgi:hypothetical protein
VRAARTTSSRVPVYGIIVKATAIANDGVRSYSDVSKKPSVYAGGPSNGMERMNHQPEPGACPPPRDNAPVSVWTDRALDAQRSNLRENRPEVEASSARVADY